jgi:hypothetical protein
MGIDQWGWDLPLQAQIAKARATNDNTLFWEGNAAPIGIWNS